MSSDLSAERPQRSATCLSKSGLSGSALSSVVLLGRFGSKSSKSRCSACPSGDQGRAEGQWESEDYFDRRRTEYVSMSRPALSRTSTQPITSYIGTTDGG